MVKSENVSHCQNDLQYYNQGEIINTFQPNFQIGFPNKNVYFEQLKKWNKHLKLYELIYYWACMQLIFDKHDNNELRRIYETLRNNQHFTNDGLWTCVKRILITPIQCKYNHALLNIPQNYITYITEKERQEAEVFCNLILDYFKIKPEFIKTLFNKLPVEYAANLWSTTEHQRQNYTSYSHNTIHSSMCFNDIDNHSTYSVQPHHCNHNSSSRKNNLNDVYTPDCNNDHDTSFFKEACYFQQNKITCINPSYISKTLPTKDTDRSRLECSSSAYKSRQHDFSKCSAIDAFINNTDKTYYMITKSKLIDLELQACVILLRLIHKIQPKKLASLLKWLKHSCLITDNNCELYYFDRINYIQHSCVPSTYFMVTQKQLALVAAKNQNNKNTITYNKNCKILTICPTSWRSIFLDTCCNCEKCLSTVDVSVSYSCTNCQAGCFFLTNQTYLKLPNELYKVFTKTQRQVRNDNHIFDTDAHECNLLKFNEENYFCKKTNSRAKNYHALIGNRSALTGIIPARINELNTSFSPEHNSSTFRKTFDNTNINKQDTKNNYNLNKNLLEQVNFCYDTLSKNLASLKNSIKNCNKHNNSSNDTVHTTYELLHHIKPNTCVNCHMMYPQTHIANCLSKTNSWSESITFKEHTYMQYKFDSLKTLTAIISISPISMWSLVAYLQVFKLSFLEFGYLKPIEQLLKSIFELHDFLSYNYVESLNCLIKFIHSFIGNDEQLNDLINVKLYYLTNKPNDQHTHITNNVS